MGKLLPEEKAIILQLTEKHKRSGLDLTFNFWQSVPNIIKNRLLEIDRKRFKKYLPRKCFELMVFYNEVRDKERDSKRKVNDKAALSRKMVKRPVSKRTVLKKKQTQQLTSSKPPALTPEESKKRIRVTYKDVSNKKAKKEVLQNKISNRHEDNSVATSAEKQDKKRSNKRINQTKRLPAYLRALLPHNNIPQKRAHDLDNIYRRSVQASESPTENQELSSDQEKPKISVVKQKPGASRIGFRSFSFVAAPVAKPRCECKLQWCMRLNPDILVRVDLYRVLKSKIICSDSKQNLIRFCVKLTQGNLEKEKLKFKRVFHFAGHHFNDANVLRKLKVVSKRPKKSSKNSHPKIKFFEEIFPEIEPYNRCELMNRIVELETLAKSSKDE